jgi:hypothetical protein
MSKEPIVRALIARWKAYRSSTPEHQRYEQIANDLYCVRNPGFNRCPPISAWPRHLVDPDDEIMASVEHYFLTRYWVGSGVYPAWEVRALKSIYAIGKSLGVTPRHNPGKPVTPSSAMQRKFQNEGVADGEVDLARWGKSAPLIARPPQYYR